jgi:hypothetical protein
MAAEIPPMEWLYRKIGAVRHGQNRHSTEAKRQRHYQQLAGSESISEQHRAFV